MIKELQFKVSNVMDAIEKPFRVTLYSKPADSPYPGNELIDDDIIVFNPGKKKTVRVDVRKYGIEIPENGFFIGAAILSKEYYSRETIFRGSMDRNQVPGFRVSNVFKPGGSYTTQWREQSKWVMYWAGKSNMCFSATILVEVK